MKCTGALSHVVAEGHTCNYGTATGWSCPCLPTASSCQQLHQCPRHRDPVIQKNIQKGISSFYINIVQVSTQLRASTLECSFPHLHTSARAVVVESYRWLDVCQLKDVLCLPERFTSGGHMLWLTSQDQQSLSLPMGFNYCLGRVTARLCRLGAGVQRDAMAGIRCRPYWACRRIDILGKASRGWL